MALSISSDPVRTKGVDAEWVGTVTFDSSYATGGESLAPADVGMVSFDQVQVISNHASYDAVWDEGNDKIKLVATGSVAAITGAVTDDDSAASNGTDVNVVLDTNSAFLAHLESTTAGNADTTFEIGDGGPVVNVVDNDSPGGVALYFDEDGDDRFIANLGHDAYVPASDGSFIKVVHNATPGTPGVAVHIDDDASNAYEKLLFVSPTDADGSYTTDTSVTLKAPGAEVASGTDVSAVTVEVRAVGS